MFYATQPKESQERYKHYLTIMGKLSRLFTTSSNLYLDSRVSEIVFCEAFQAYNTSRDDSTSDANINGLGVGIKTFIYNKSCFQKIAEFNAARKHYKDFKDTELINYLAEARNERIRLTQAQYGLERLIYHYVTKTTKAFSIFEQEMPVINTDSLKIKKSDERSLIFTDDLKEYNFNRSKSVLQMRFDSLLPIDTLEVDVLENPLSFLESCFEKSEYSSILTPVKSKVLDEIYLPLYVVTPRKPYKYGDVPIGTSINKWFANGRPRNDRELAILIPSVIHDIKPHFFSTTPDKNRFDLILPNGNSLVARACGGKKGREKDLESNPNKALGEWLIDDIFQIDMNNPQPITREYLNTIGIDAVKISKLDETHYAIDFAKIGAFEEFLLSQDDLPDPWRNKLTDLANG